MKIFKKKGKKNYDHVTVCPLNVAINILKERQEGQLILGVHSSGIVLNYFVVDAFHKLETDN